MLFLPLIAVNLPYGCIKHPGKCAKVPAEAGSHGDSKANSAVGQPPRGTRKCREWPTRSHRDRPFRRPLWRSEEHTSELQSLMRISYAVFCLKQNKQQGNRVD